MVGKTGTETKARTIVATAVLVERRVVVGGLYEVRVEVDGTAVYETAVGCDDIDAALDIAVQGWAEGLADE